MAVVFPTTALRWKKSNLHQHEKIRKKIRDCFSIGRNIHGKSFALICTHRNRKQNKEFHTINVKNKFSRQKSQNKIQVFKLVPYTTHVHTHTQKYNRYLR